MPRIAKADVNKALTLAAKSIIDAAGSDGRTSRAEMKAALTKLPKEHKALADIFFKFIDHRDFRTGAQVTEKDVKRAVAYAKTHLIAKYDLNNDGLSKAEISKMSLTGRRAVDLARVLKTAGTDGTTTLDSAKLGTAVNKHAKDAWFISESDYHPQYFAKDFPALHDLNGHNVMMALRPELAKHFEDATGLLGDYTAEVFTSREAKDFINGLSEVSDPNDPGLDPSAKAFGEITRLLEANLKDLHVAKVGPRDSSGKLATDNGLYSYVVIGRAADGKVAGIMLGAVET
ncbi:MAG: hypothetical protein AMXMBFR34_48860 [Myxococcaceae bacterium]